MDSRRQAGLLDDWLTRHAAECLVRVEAWLVSSLPVPTELLVRVWPDEAWRSALRDLVVVAEGTGEVGFLRDVTGRGDMWVLGQDGETVPLSPTPPTVTLPHPLLLPGLAELREFAAAHGIVQGVEQLHRAIWRRPEDRHGLGTEVRDFAGAWFPSRYALAARAASLGYRTTGAYSTCRVRDGERAVEAALWIGDPWDQRARAELGGLFWSDLDGRALPLREVGPVAWSEGMRMASALHAGRVIET